MGLATNHPEVKKAKAYTVVSWSGMKQAKPIETEKISSFRHVLYSMVKTCLKDNGVGLCANQVGINWTMFVMQMIGKPEFIGCFNPSWKAHPTDQTLSEISEGCLSSAKKGKKYVVSRPTKILATWTELLPDGKILERKDMLLTGMQARIFMHEYDHLSLVDISMVGKEQ